MLRSGTSKFHLNQKSLQSNQAAYCIKSFVILNTTISYLFPSNLFKAEMV